MIDRPHVGPQRRDRHRRPGAALALLAGLAAAAVGHARPAAHASGGAAVLPDVPSAAHPTVLIRNARIVDGTGAPAFRGAVRLHGDRIAEVGDLEPRASDARVLDARGLVLAPGFIDTHSHHDRGLLEDRRVTAAVSQGITTIVVGQDGAHRFPLASFFDSLRAHPAAVNVASFAGHGTLRRGVLGDDFRRPATLEEVEAMRALLEREMEAGALGLSSGLEYDPGIYAGTEEVVALASQAAADGGVYATHLRSEDRALWDAVDEAVRIGREAGLPVHLSHLKLAMRGLWGRADELLARLEAARASGVEVTADVYPYTYWQSTMTVLFPERDYADTAAAEFALRELVAPEDVLLARYAPEPTYEGRTLADVAAERGEAPAAAYLALIARAESMRDTADPEAGVESIIATSMHPDDVSRLLAWPHANVCSDGSSGGGHPRGYGAFPRALRILVRERGLLSLEEAVHRMTGLAAAHVRIRGSQGGPRPARGVIEPLAYADLVLFDPEAIADRATPEEPTRRAVGIERVWVNGREVWVDGEATGATPGRVIRWPGM